MYPQCHVSFVRCSLESLDSGAEKRSPEGCAPIPYMMHDGSTAVHQVRTESAPSVPAQSSVTARAHVRRASSLALCQPTWGRPPSTHGNWDAWFLPTVQIHPVLLFQGHESVVAGAEGIRRLF